MYVFNVFDLELIARNCCCPRVVTVITVVIGVLGLCLVSSAKTLATLLSHCCLISFYWSQRQWRWCQPVAVLPSATSSVCVLLQILYCWQLQSCFDEVAYCKLQKKNKWHTHTM